MLPYTVYDVVRNKCIILYIGRHRSRIEEPRVQLNERKEQGEAISDGSDEFMHH